MARQTGITATSPQRFLIDAGKLYANYGEVDEIELGATRGGNVFSIESDQKDMVMDGSLGRVKGATRIVTVNAMLTVNLLELTPEFLQLAFPGSTIADYGSPVSHDLLTRAAVIDLTDYLTNVTIVANTTVGATKYAMLMIKNALGDGNLELTMTDKEEAVPSITFNAHFDPSDLDTEPWEIYWPKEA